jgi:Mg2+ and Co2+ transporter CorA
MEKKRLFDEVTERRKEVAHQLSDEFYAAVAPIFEKYQKEGYSVREIAMMMEYDVAEIMLTYIVGWKD